MEDLDHLVDPTPLLLAFGVHQAQRRIRRARLQGPGLQHGTQGGLPPDAAHLDGQTLRIDPAQLTRDVKAWESLIADSGRLPRDGMGGGAQQVSSEVQAGLGDRAVAGRLVEDRVDGVVQGR